MTSPSRLRDVLAELPGRTVLHMNGIRYTTEQLLSDQTEAALDKPAMLKGPAIIVELTPEVTRPLMLLDPEEEEPWRG